jgi:methylated-DNA-protein-cysteine methyltransferase-like protein
MPAARKQGRERREAGRAAKGRRRDGFFARVYALVARIPRGKVATYGQIARMLGAPRAARTVGWAMHDNPHGSRVPCQRVVQQGGSCSPNFRIGDPGAQRRLLEREGVWFLLDGRIDMQAHQWRPELDRGRPGGAK